jgi:hypothetical protein
VESGGPLYSFIYFRLCPWALDENYNVMWAEFNYSVAFGDYHEA